MQISKLHCWNTSILKQEGEVAFTPSSSAIGAGGTQAFRFKAIGTGQTTLTLVYRRPWENNVAPTQTFTIQVSVS